MSAAHDVRPGEEEPLARLVRTVTRSPRFSLSFAVANSPLQRERLLRVLARRLAPEHVLLGIGLERSVAPAGAESLLDEIAAAVPGGAEARKQVVCVWGLERAFGKAPEAGRRVLDQLSRERERYAQRLNVPLVFWLPEFVLERIGREAPDFWAWRSGVFTFPEEPVVTLEASAEPAGLLPALSSLTADEKRRRIGANRELLGRLSSAPAAARQAAPIEMEIAQLSHALGDIDAAAQAYREAERLAQAAGDSLTALRAAAEIEALGKVTGTKAGEEPAKEGGEVRHHATQKDEPLVPAVRASIPDLVVTLRPRTGAIHEVSVNGTVSHTVDLSGLAVRPTSLFRKLPGATQAEVGRFGRRLAEALFAPGTASEEAWRAFRARRDGRLVLQLGSLHAAAIPWEYATNHAGRLIVLDVPMFRSPELDRRGGGMSAERDHAVRVLLVESDPLLGPGDSQTVPGRIPVDRESAELIGALRRTGRRYAFRRVAPPTIKSLQVQLARRAVSIVHFNGHGAVEPEPLLCFEDESGRLDPVPASDFVARTAGHAWLVVLSACLSAAMPSGRAVSLAHALAVAGVPWVVGMQDVVGVDAARTFVEVFYRYLGEGHPTWDAVHQARIAIGGDGWSAGLPVLYGRPDDPAVIPTQPTGDLVEEMVEERDRLAWREDLSVLRAPTRFFGRERELVAIGRALQNAGKLITLVGAGGMGKSALAYQAARRFAWRFPAGLFSVSLAGTPESLGADALLLLGQHLLGPKFGELLPEAQDQQLVEALRARQCLVVVDNAEDTLRAVETSAAARHMLRILRNAAGGHAVLVVTSQDALRWPGEHPVEVLGLDPEASWDLLREYLGDRTLSRDDQSTLKRVLSRLQHHPLAIRLVAPAWLESGLSPAALDQRLERFIATAKDQLADRESHRSLDACFRYAYEALAKPDRESLCDLSLFSAPFLDEAAGATLGVDPPESRALLNRLAGHSFLQSPADEGGSARLFSFQPQVRLFVQRRVHDEQRDVSIAQQRFAAAHVALIAQAHAAIGKAEWQGYQALVSLTLPDLIRAVELSTQSERSLAALRLGRVVEALGALDQAQRLFAGAKVAAEVASDDRSASQAAHAMANIHRVRGDLDGAMRLYEESLAIKERLGDLQGKGATLHAMAYIHRVRGDLDGAMRLYEESLAIDERLGDLQGKGATLAMIGQLQAGRGRVTEAIQAIVGSLQALARLRSAEIPKVMAMIRDMRNAIGAEKFDRAWQEVTGQDIPDWFSGGAMPAPDVPP